MADNSGLIKIAAIGAAMWLAYTEGWLSFLGIGAASSSATAATTGTPAASAVASPPAASVPAITSAPPAPNPKANVLDGIYTAMVKAANAPSAGLGVDAWGYYLNNQLAPLGLQAPDPQPLFSDYITAINALALPGAPVLPAFDRSTFLVTAPIYWGVMAPALRTQLGLSGLGIYGGLGALVRRYA
jgi:hypothetical protein